MDPFEAAVGRFTAREKLAAAGARVVVAVSGGADSTALLFALAALAPANGWRLAVAHLDHALRPDSAEDAAFVAGQARALALPFYGARVDVRGLPSSVGRSPEEAARVARRVYLTKVARAVGADAVALGHTGDDQAETVVINLARGAGTLGRGGMPPRLGLFVRPLLELTREDVLAYLARRRLSWREDPTNRDPAFTRNRVRHEILPALEAAFPGARRRLAAAAAAARAEEDLLEDQTAALLAPFVVSETTDAVVLDGAWPAAFPAGLRGRAVRRLNRRLAGTLAGLERRHADEVVALKRGAVNLPGGVRVRRGGRGLVFEKVPRSAPVLVSWSVRVVVPGVTRVPPFPWGVAARVEAAPAAWPAAHWWEVWLDPSLRDGLVVRNWRPGDRVTPTGMTGSKKLQDLFVDAKIPRGERRRWPVVSRGGVIVWVPGLALAAGAGAAGPGRPALKLTYIGPPATTVRRAAAAERTSHG